MVIKKFIGRTEEEAVEAARKELGAGVVIMNVKKVRKKGVFTFMKKQMVEVTVALEEEAEKFTPVKKEQGTPIVTPASVQSAPIRPAARENNGIKAEVEILEEKLDTLQTLLVKQMQQPREEEIQETAAGEKEPAEDTTELMKFLKLLNTTMLDNEVDEKYVSQMMDELEKVHKPGMPFDYALANTYQKMVLKFGKPVEITTAEKGVKTIFFIGPTGVGKTTTIAKIASKFTVEDKKKVALLTADTFRIAAAEQLRTYANILETPFRVIYTVEELQAAVKDFANFDYIFIDTAGHSPGNNSLKESMGKLVNCMDGTVEKEVFLVLSATTKYRDLMNIADSYKGVADYRLIFTKLDETTAFGNLLNLKLYTGASMSYVTCGQNVPDDIEKFNPQKTVKKLLGGKK